METITFIFFLLVCFQIKHLMADYFLQDSFMLKKFSPGWEFVFPLVAHAGVHSVFTLILCLVFSPYLWWLALVDFVTHFIIDRIKAGPKYLGRFKALSGVEIKQVFQDKHMGAVRQDQKRVNEANKKLKHNTYFWWSLGLDQASHSLVHYFIIFMLTMDKIT